MNDSTKAYIDGLIQVENVRFWKQLGGRPDFEGEKVYDFGCSHDRSCIDTERGS